MRNSLNFNETLLYLMALTAMKPLFFVLFGVFIADLYLVLRYLLQTFIWFCLLNTPVTLVTANVALFENGSADYMLIQMPDVFSNERIDYHVISDFFEYDF